MKNNAEALKILEETLSKYKKNRTLVPEADLKGKYKIPFERLKDQLKADLEKFLADTLKDIVVFSDDSGDFIREVQTLYDREVARQISEAAYLHCSIAEVEGIAVAFRRSVIELYRRYWLDHIGLLAEPECFSAVHPHKPLWFDRIYGRILKENGWVSIRTEAMHGA